MERFEKFAAAGLDIAWLRGMEQKHSPVVFDLIENLLAQGFSVSWVVAALDKLHPLMMDVFAHVFSAAPVAAARMGVSADDLSALAEGTPTSMLQGPLVTFLIEKVITMLPSLGLSGWKLAAATMALNFLLESLKNAPAAK